MPLVLRDKLSQFAEFAVWKIEETPAFFSDQLIFSDREQEFLDSISHPSRKLQWLASRFVLKFLMNTDEFVELLTDSDGKPYVSNFDIHVSLSHSTRFAAAIISKDYHVGIDVEEPDRNIKVIQHKFLSVEELQNIEPEISDKKLLLYWAAKEVIYKIYGKRKLEFREDMFIKPFQLRSRGEISGMLMKHGTVCDYLMHYIVKEEFFCVAGVEGEVEII